MILNYLKIALRNLLRYKWNSILNIIGLSIGIACFVYIYFLLKHEIEYDTFHKDIDQIYRICQKGYSTEKESVFAATQQKFSDYIKENFDQVEYMARFAPNRVTQIKYKDKHFQDGPTQYVENDFFKIINLPFELGDPNSCLEKPNTVVLTKRVAEKYFGEENPLGKLIKIDTAFFEVTGVLKKLPDNTRFKLDFYLSWPSYKQLPEGVPHVARFLTTYIKLKPGTDPIHFENEIKEIPNTLDWEFKRADENKTLFIQALKDIHLSGENDFTWDWEVPASKTYLYILFITGLFILIVSSLNYINLTSTRYSTRYKEIAIKKTVGATKKNIILQFIGESMIVVFISHILGMFLLEFAITPLNNITQYSFSVDYSSVQLWIVLLSIIFLIGFGAGSYPAFYMSSFSPTLIQEKSFLKNRKSNLKWILVAIQFTISIILIIGTLMIDKQVNYMKNKKLGFLKDNKIVIEFPGNAVNPDNYLSIKDEFKSNPTIIGATISSSVPGRWRYNWRLYPAGEESTNSHLINCMQVDHDYFNVYGLEMIAGETFSDDMSDNSNMGFIFNEKAIEEFGWNDPEIALTKKMMFRSDKIKGVMKNFHSKGLQNPIAPLGVFLIVEDYRFITLQLADNSELISTLKFLESKYNELFPDKVFNYFFLDDDFDKQYKSEDKIMILFKIFAFIGVLNACIGLFGISMFICQKREKEIGIRKVHGANAKQIFVMLSKEFTYIILIAFIIAIPFAYYGANAWLSNFAYRIDVPWYLIFIAGAIAWLIAMLTISFQAVKSAIKNPVDSLRYE